MMRGFRRLSIMKSNHGWTFLHVSILAGLLLTLNADSNDADCYVDLRVPQNTVYEAYRGEDLRINCTVGFCDGSPPIVTWYKREKTDVAIDVNSSSHFKTEWELLEKLEGISFLIFQKILRNDSGQYQCGSGGTVSHNINVSVSDLCSACSKDDGRPKNDTQKNSTDTITLVHEPTSSLQMYFYFAAGIVAFVIIVIIISIVSMQGCKGKSKKKGQTENQYVAVPMGPFPHVSPQPSPRGSPSVPPPRRSTRRKPPPSQPNELPLPRDNEHVYGIKENRERQTTTVDDEGCSLVYAALNHQVPARPVARPRRPKEEEASEYAAIRVKDLSTTSQQLNHFKADDSSH
ncbi:B- and T-lymphocyte attenuator-like [Plectropomus leopardus]|uniref:B- and T-lymphocyte attenuator-like n=1 Tax=Plectropomus leopardus TaxID=160734 RepID=UPI001C4AAD1A|nr:B- and T-lymphocyte attenuator-like [Plectropomus leopardus]